MEAIDILEDGSQVVAVLVAVGGHEKPFKYKDELPVD